MPFPWKAVAVGGLALGVTAAVARAFTKTLPVSKQRVALIGDSYAVGLGPELAKLLPDFKYGGVVGTNTFEWANHTKDCGSCGDWIPSFHPDVVLVSLGVNDAQPNLANYQTLVSGLHGIGAKVIWIEPPAAVRTSSIDAVRKTIASLGVPTVPAPTLPMANSLHPASYDQWAKAVASAIAPGKDG